MRVILTQEVKGKGGEGDVVEVARGYAVNYLLPRKLAVEATPGNLKQLEARKQNISARENARIEEARALAALLEAKSVLIEAKIGDEGRLFGSVTAPMIADAIESQLGVQIDRRKLEVADPIKEAGARVVTAQLFREVKADIRVEVIAEGSRTPEPTE